MSQPRPWPNNALRDKEDALAAAAEGERTLRPLVDGESVSDTDRERRVGKAWGLFHKIASILKSS